MRTTAGVIYQSHVASRKGGQVGACAVVYEDIRIKPYMVMEDIEL